MDSEILELSKEDQAFFQPFPFVVYTWNNSVELTKYIQLLVQNTRFNCSQQIAKYNSVAELLLDFLRNDKWFHSASEEKIKIIKGMTHRIYVEPRFPLKLPSVRYQNEIAARPSHLYGVTRVKGPIMHILEKMIDDQLFKMEREGKPLPKLPGRSTMEDLETCMEILKISPPEANGFQFHTADDLISWALEETAKQELIIAPCKNCGQLFVKGKKNHYCSRRCSDLAKVDCGRFCGDTEIQSLYNHIYKALDRNLGRSTNGYTYRDDNPSSPETRDALFSDLSAQYENFTCTEHSFSESDFAVLNQTFRQKMFAPRYENFKCAYRSFKITELTEEEYNIARTNFLNWLQEVKKLVNSFVRK